MSRMKTFFIYALIVAVIVICTDLIVNFILNSNYKEIQYDIGTVTPKVEITEAKTTYMNGYIKGTITNNTGIKITNQFIKMDFYSSRKNKVGTEYLKVDSLEVEETKNFALNYQIKNVDHLKLTIVGEETEEVLEYHPLIEHAEVYFKIAGFIVWLALPPFYILNLFL